MALQGYAKQFRTHDPSIYPDRGSTPYSKHLNPLCHHDQDFYQQLFFKTNHFCIINIILLSLFKATHLLLVILSNKSFLFDKYNFFVTFQSYWVCH